MTAPAPEPAFATDSAQVSGANDAVTDRAVVIDNVQVEAVPEHEPAHPVKIEPSPGTAVNVTDWPWAMSAEQSDAQSIPPTLDSTLPDAAPVADVFAVNTHASGENPAVTDRTAVIDNVQVSALPEHDPLHPVKTDPAAGVAVSVTDVPSSNALLQVEPHSMPSGADRTTPTPDPTSVRLSVRCPGPATTGAGTLEEGGEVDGTGVVGGTGGVVLGGAGDPSTATTGAVGGTGPIEATSASCTVVGTVVTTTGDSLSGGTTASAGTSTTTAAPTANPSESACGEATTVPTPVAMTPLNTLRLTARPTLDDNVAPAPTATVPMVVVVTDTTDAAVPVMVAAADALEVAAPCRAPGSALGTVVLVVVPTAVADEPDVDVPEPADDPAARQVGRNARGPSTTGNATDSGPITRRTDENGSERKARTTVGSNCEPAQRPNSAMASLVDEACR